MAPPGQRLRVLTLQPLKAGRHKQNPLVNADSDILYIGLIKRSRMDREDVDAKASGSAVRFNDFD
ncbi:MAG: hypothetical protein ACT6R2_00040, partial [Blastomonas fulva]|uniref:hypothetical protein n=1 Tax=Blastomonas fulva TaxID=1550728 RepID=UPI00403388CA